jgi:hypothetical protein
MFHFRVIVIVIAFIEFILSKWYKFLCLLLLTFILLNKQVNK